MISNSYWKVGTNQLKNKMEDLPVIKTFGWSKITPRYDQGHKLKKMIGRVARSNMFSTLRGKLLYIDKGKCYFELLENHEWVKYNQCAGQVEWLNEYMVVTMKFEEE